MKIAFLFEGGASWLGGINYLWNLLYALTVHARDDVTPVLFSVPGTDLCGLDRLVGVEHQTLPPTSGAPLSRLATITSRRVGGTDRALAALLSAQHIDLVSHSDTFGWRFPIPAIPWIPDLQHRRLPEYFSFRERRARDYRMLRALVEGRAVIVSSDAAARDVRAAYGPLARRLEVLRFVSQPRIPMADLASLDELRARHRIPGRYFFLPNQFWRHKNHRVVVDALATLADGTDPPVVVLTGLGEDYRAPHHYEALMREVRDKRLDRLFVHLGTVPFGDVIALIRHSIAVINPSLFEGWSTSVEECRSLGKRTVLSDIDVHREQDPPGARYFHPDDPRGLALVLEEVWRTAPPGPDPELEQAAAAALPGRTAEFASAYVAIARRALAGARFAGPV